MTKIVNRKRKPNEANLAGLMVVNSDIAWDYKNRRWRKGVYGAVDKELTFITTTVQSKDGTRRRKFVNDVTELPNVTNERVMAFFDNKQNVQRSKCYLVEKSLYEEMVKGRKKV